MSEKLTAKEAAFVREYPIDFNATAAAKRAGYSAKTAYQIGHALLRKAHVRAAVDAAIEQISARATLSADQVLQRLSAIAVADANEISQFRRCACDHCWGGEPEEREQLEGQAHGGALKRTRKAAEEVNPKDPDPDCNECGGDGVGRAYFADTRKLAGSARALFAGVKVTRDGVELKTHDQVAALVQLGRYHKLWTDKSEVAASGLEALLDAVASRG